MLFSCVCNFHPSNVLPPQLYYYVSVLVCFLKSFLVILKVRCANNSTIVDFKSVNCLVKASIALSPSVLFTIFNDSTYLFIISFIPS